MNKKSAIISAQFNWIFVLIIGVILFLFFVTLARNQKDIGEQQIELETKSKLSTILSGQTVLEEGTSLITLTSPITLKNSDFDELVFSPSEIESSIFTLQTKPIKSPFFITNALYVTSPDVYYVFVWNDEDEYNILEYYYDEMPDKFMQGTNNEPVLACNKHLVKINSDDDSDYMNLIEDINNFKGNQKVRFIMIEDERILITNSNIEITYAILNLDIGTYSPSEILGYIYSDNEVEFDLNIEKINKKKTYIAKVYENKIQKLKDNVDGVMDSIQAGRCINVYSQMEVSLEDYERLSTFNQNLQYLSCPILY